MFNNIPKHSGTIVTEFDSKSSLNVIFESHKYLNLLFSVDIENPLSQVTVQERNPISSSSSVQLILPFNGGFGCSHKSSNNKILIIQN